MTGVTQLSAFQMSDDSSYELPHNPDDLNTVSAAMSLPAILDQQLNYFKPTNPNVVATQTIIATGINTYDQPTEAANLPWLY